jgi:cell fate regulator YaaT (PSP1 superfamily)
MGHYLGLKFREPGQIYYFDAGPFVVNEGDHVIVKTDQGMGLGKVVMVKDEMPEDLGDKELKRIFRLATEEDMAGLRENEDLAREAREYCRRCISGRALEMKLVDVEVYFDRSKIVFYFTAPGRIDFRELVKDLVKEYRTRIELRQIGVRHETQMLGAVGNCGQVACCKRFMRKFEPVTIKMAKEQNLFLNPTKISGICGRLLCCLAFEEENYENFYRQCPKLGKKMTTDMGNFKVLRANFFKGTLSVLSESNEELEIPLEDWHAANPRPYDPGSSQPEQQERRAETPSRAGKAEREPDSENGKRETAGEEAESAQFEEGGDAAPQDKGKGDKAPGRDRSKAAPGKKARPRGRRKGRKKPGKAKAGK